MKLAQVSQVKQRGKEEELSIFSANSRKSKQTKIIGSDCKLVQHNLQTFWQVSVKTTHIYLCLMDTAIPPYGTRGQNSVKGTGGRWAWVEGADGRGM